MVRAREQGVESTDEPSSLGVNFVEQRLLIMSKIDDKKYGVEIIDKVNPEGGSAGMRVIVTMPIQKKQ